MSLEEETDIPLKIKRIAENTNIHNLFIFNRAGICLFGRNFTNHYHLEDNLISSFFTALMSFTREVVGNKIKTIEMGGNIKFVIIEKNHFYYGLLCRSVENILLFEELIKAIDSLFLEYIHAHNVNISTEYVYNETLNKKVDAILEKYLSTEFDIKKEEIIIHSLKALSKNDEIEGIILLTDKGKVVYSTYDAIKSRTFLKEVEFRVKICNNSILKLFYTSKNKELIFSEYVKDLYFIILVFNAKTTKIGIAEFYLRKAIKTIQKILEK